MIVNLSGVKERDSINRVHGEHCYSLLMVRCTAFIVRLVVISFLLLGLFRPPYLLFNIIRLPYFLYFKGYGASEDLNCRAAAVFFPPFIQLYSYNNETPANPLSRPIFFMWMILVIIPMLSKFWTSKK